MSETSGGKPSWKNRLKQVADQGKAVAEQGKAKLAEQSAKRAQQWAEDPATLWFGESKDAAASATGLSKARYRITRDRVWIDSGLLGTRTETVPLWSVKDIDVQQAVWQRGKDVGDVVLTLEDPAYGAAAAGMFDVHGAGDAGVHGTTSGSVVLDNVEGPYAVVDLLTPLVSEARAKKTVERQSTYVHSMTPPVAAVPQQASAPAASVAEQLRELAALRDDGILSDEEFAAQKARLLGV